MQRARNFQTLERYSLDAQLAKLTGNTEGISEPYQRAAKIPSTIRTDNEWLLYLAYMGVLGYSAKIAAWTSAAKESKLAVYVPSEANVVGEFQVLAEDGRDGSGGAHQANPQTDERNRASFGTSPNNFNPYNYKGYSPNVYLKPALERAKSAYTGISKKVRETFGKIRSVYQSSAGVIKAISTYRGKSRDRAAEDPLVNYLRSLAKRMYSLRPASHRNLDDLVSQPA